MCRAPPLETANDFFRRSRVLERRGPEPDEVSPGEDVLQNVGVVCDAAEPDDGHLYRARHLPGGKYADGQDGASTDAPAAEPDGRSPTLDVDDEPGNRVHDGDSVRAGIDRE